MRHFEQIFDFFENIRKLRFISINRKFREIICKYIEIWNLPKYETFNEVKSLAAQPTSILKQEDDHRWIISMTHEPDEGKFHVW